MAKINYGIVERRELQKINENIQLQNLNQYQLISPIDTTVCHVDFVKGVPQKVSGALSTMIIRQTEGKIKVYDPAKEEAIAAQEAVLEGLEQMKEFMKDKKSKKEETDTTKEQPKPKVESNSKKSKK